MRITFFDFTINYGGAPQGSLYLMKRLQDSGYECSIIDAYGICKEYKTQATKYDLRYYVLASKSRYVSIGHSDKIFLRLISILKQSKELSIILINLIKTLTEISPNVVIVNNEKSLFFLNIVQKFFKFKIVFYFRAEGTKSQLNRRLLKSLNSKTDIVVAHSKTAVRNIVNSGIKKNHVQYIPNCVELEKFDKACLNMEITKSKKFKVILTAARPVREKGHDIAVKALKILNDKGYDIDLFFPGTTPTGVDKSYENLLKNLINQYGLEENVHFLGWRDNLISDIASCNLVILPSHTEGFPRTIIESMLQGIPVCATPVGGIPEAINHMDTGLLFDVDNVQSLADNIQLMIDNHDIYQTISKNAENFARNHFDPIHNTNGMKLILQNL